jgi:hypothetical protein
MFLKREELEKRRKEVVKEAVGDEPRPRRNGRNRMVEKDKRRGVLEKELNTIGHCQ